ncbi:MAG: hypothetical protein JO317_09370 [Verrucomicrobiae bacterium]|nr:hypothetical protein [Verrucomicrobiae bacterium]
MKIFPLGTALMMGAALCLVSCSNSNKASGLQTRGTVQSVDQSTLTVASTETGGNTGPAGGSSTASGATTTAVQQTFAWSGDTIVLENGSKIQPSAIKAGDIVRVYYDQNGNEMKARQVVLETPASSVASQEPAYYNSAGASTNNVDATGSSSSTSSGTMSNPSSPSPSSSSSSSTSSSDTSTMNNNASGTTPGSTNGTNSVTGPVSPEPSTGSSTGTTNP